MSENVNMSNRPPKDWRWLHPIDAYETVIKPIRECWAAYMKLRAESQPHGPQGERATAYHYQKEYLAESAGNLLRAYDDMREHAEHERADADALRSRLTLTEAEKHLVSTFTMDIIENGTGSWPIDKAQASDLLRLIKRLTGDA